MHTNAIPILNLTYIHSTMLRLTIIVVGIISCVHDASTFVSASVDRQGYMHTTSLLYAVLLIHCWCPMLGLLQFFLVRRSVAVWVGVWSQISISFFLTCLLLFNSILWCRGVKDRVLIITCSPIVSFTIAQLCYGILTSVKQSLTFMNQSPVRLLPLIGLDECQRCIAV